jgi:hypothetical protein
MTLSDFVLVKDNVFTNEFCDELVEFFENNPEYRHIGQSMGGLNKDIKDTTDLNMFYQPELMEMYGNFILSKFNEVVEELLERLPFQNVFPAVTRVFNDDTEYTTCQIQKYNKGTGHYNAYHYETDSYGTTPRLFVFILYLNDVAEGGETELLYEKSFTKPKKGRVLVHPAGYPFVHRGLTPISDDKYIVTTWLAYSEQDY